MEEELLKVKMSNIIFFIVLYIILLSSVFFVKSGTVFIIILLTTNVLTPDSIKDILYTDSISFPLSAIAWCALWIVVNLS